MQKILKEKWMFRILKMQRNILFTSFKPRSKRKRANKQTDARVWRSLELFKKAGIKVEKALRYRKLISSFNSCSRNKDEIFLTKDKTILYQVLL